VTRVVSRPVTSPTRTARLAVLVALAAVGGACSVSTDAREGANDLPPAEEREQGEPEVQTTGPTIPEMPGNFLTDPGAAPAAIDAITAELGAVMVRSFDLYDHYAIFEAQDPTIPENLDSYTFRDGELEKPDPIHVTNSDLEALPNQLFSLADVRWDIVAQLSQTAVAQLGIEDGVVNHMGVDRSYDTFELRLSLSVTGPRRSGSLEATADGTVLEAELF
jgi:hypothetical protein